MVIYQEEIDNKIQFLIVISELPLEKDQFVENMYLPEFYTCLEIIKIANSIYNNNTVLLKNNLVFVETVDIKYDKLYTEKILQSVKSNISLSEFLLTNKLNFQFHELDMIYNENKYNFDLPCLFKNSLNFCINKILKMNKKFIHIREDIINLSKINFMIKSINANYEPKNELFNITLESSIEVNSKYLIDAYKSIHRSSVKTDEANNIRIDNLKNKYHNFYDYLKMNILRGFKVNLYLQVFEYSMQKYMINRRLLEIINEQYDRDKDSYIKYFQKVDIDKLFDKIYYYED